LKNNLDTRNISSKQALEWVKLISEAVKAAEITNGEILELEALIYFELGEYNLAIKKYEELKTEENASFSVAALEKYCNTRSKNCVLEFKSGKSKSSFIVAMNAIMTERTELLKRNNTAERVSLIGSAYKRKGMVTHNGKGKLSAYSNAALRYQKAFEIKPGAYALNNWIVLQTVVGIINRTPSKQVAFGSKSKDEIIAEVENRKMNLCSSFNNMDYWELIEEICYDFSLLILDAEKAKDDNNWKKLESRYKRIWKRSGSRGKKMAEIENFEIVSDALSLSTSKQALYLKEKIDALRQGLQNLFSEE